MLLLSDTVGFVRRLPHQLVEAFRSTLQETAGADFLVHVVDASEPSAPEQVAAVREVLDAIGAGHLPEILVLNKADLADDSTALRLQGLYPEAVTVSATEGTGIEELKEPSGRTSGPRLGGQVELLIPYTRGRVLGVLRREAEVLAEDHTADGTLVSVRLPKDQTDRYREFALGL